MGVSLQIEWGRIYLKEMKLFYVANGTTQTLVDHWTTKSVFDWFMLINTVITSNQDNN